LDRIKRTG
jgi:hypothetical protein